MNDSARNILSTGAAELEINLDNRRLDMFDSYTALLLEWNSRFNLTRITDPLEIVVKHYLDSLSILSVMEIPSDAHLIDIGTGAGLPAIPLKIAIPSLKITMLDSVRKKLTFLETVIRDMDLSDMRLIHGRAEDFGRDKVHREKYHFAVSRAVARLNVLAELCMPFCRVGGKFIAYKGPESDAEVREAEKAIGTLGGEIEAVRTLTLPNSDLNRTLVVVKKLKPTPGRYPRKPGDPEREPL